MKHEVRIEDHSVKPGMEATHNTRRGLRRQRMAGLDLTVFERKTYREIHLTLRPLANEQPAALFQRMAAVLKEHDATIVWQQVFGKTDISGACLREMQSAFGELSWPVNWVQGNPCSGGGGVAGVHVMAVSGTPVETIWLDEHPVGRSFSDGSCRHCLFGDIHPSDRTRLRTLQTEEVYRKLEAGLAHAGMNFLQVIRTWFFLDQLLQWYGPFNVVRNEYYNTYRARLNPIPASTGIEASNRHGGALVLGAWAVEPLNDQVSLTEVFSPLQCPAPKYGSGFSRAVEIRDAELQRVLVSGTASIHPDGSSAFDGDIDAQVELTMEVVEAMLATRNLGWNDVTRATAYFKNAQDASALARWCSAHEVKPMPTVLTEAPVCREELLFEIELDALAPVNSSAAQA